jgi:anti-sigma factor RsiW
MTIPCQQASDWLDQALEGTLSPRDERAWRRHLEECPRCRRRFELAKRASDALRCLPDVEPPADLPQQVMSALPSISPQALGQIAGVVRRAAQDPDLRRRLRADPESTLRALQVDLPAGLRVEVVTETPAPLPTPQLLYLPLPEAPLQLEALEERLAATSLGSLFGLWW